jgi:hypothetical protein
VHGTATGIAWTGCGGGELGFAATTGTTDASAGGFEGAIASQPLNAFRSAFT